MTTLGYVLMPITICSTRRSGREAGRLPGWGVDRRRRPPLAIFLASLDILHLPAHGVPLHGEVIHPQVLVGCGRIQAEHERWGRADVGVTEMGKPERHRDRQTVTQTDRGRDREQKRQRNRPRQREKQTDQVSETDIETTGRKTQDGEKWRGQPKEPEE